MRNRRRWLRILITGVAALLVAGESVQAVQRHKPIAGVSGRFAAPVLTPAMTARWARQTLAGAVVNRQSQTITYRSRHVRIVALAAPVALHRHGMQWVIDGLVNPTIQMPVGAQVQVVVINADTTYWHGFAVTAVHDFVHAPDVPIFAGAFIGMVPPITPAGDQWAETTFVAARVGTFHYVCWLPGHAARGMRGTWVVVRPPSATR